MNKEKISKWFLDNFKVHTDWTGSYVETQFKCNSVKDVIDKFIRDNFKKIWFLSLYIFLFKIKCVSLYC